MYSWAHWQPALVRGTCRKLPCSVVVLPMMSVAESDRPRSAARSMPSTSAARATLRPTTLKLEL